MRLLFLALILFSQNSYSQEIASLKFDVEKYTLENGMTVLLHQDSTSPIVSYHTWFRVGSKDEEVGYTGIAHLFEHMMFKGTKKYSAKDYERILREIGAVNNAFTYFDYTGYYVNAPASQLEKVMDLESDRITNLIIDKSNLDSEREVVKEERRYRVENSVLGTLMETIYGVVYTTHSYKWPIIGYMKDLNNISVQKATEFYKQYYSPNNAVVVVAGDIDISKTKKLIEKYYGDMKSQSIQRPLVKIEPEQKAARSEVIYKDIQNDYISLSYRIPEIKSELTPAFELASQILGDGQSSRLYRKLVDEMAIATQVFSYTTSTKDSSIFTVVAALKPEKNKTKANAVLAQAEKVLKQEMKKISAVSLKDLEKVKNKVMKAHVDGLKGVDGKAHALAMNEIVLDDYKALFDDIKKYLDVSVKDIQKLVPYFEDSKSNKVVARPSNFKIINR